MKEEVASFPRNWLGILESLVAAAQQEGDLDSREDPAQLAYEIDAYLLMANMAYVMNSDPATLECARAAIRSRLGRARR